MSHDKAPSVARVTMDTENVLQEDNQEREAVTEQVLLVRVTFDGVTITEWMEPEEAAMLARHDPDNGVTWARAWIVADDVNMGDWDRTP